ncbi:MAG: DNA recombination protein RmuC [Aeriscardovia sp.]|nr:DNA recombination protein RmuC [Aeriscardovia sp.]
MTALYVAVAGACCLAAGFLIGFFLKPQKKAPQAPLPASEKESGQLESDLEKKEEEAAALKESLESLRSQKEGLARENSALLQKCGLLEERVAELKDGIVKSEAAFEERLKAQKEEREAAEERLRFSIKEEFEKSRQAQRDAEGRQEGDNQRRADVQAEILKSLEPLRGDVSALRSKLGEIEEGRRGEVGQLKESIEDLRRMEQAISEENKNFSSLLNNNQLRGRWGEVQLENLVEKCGMEKHVDFDTQLTLSGEGKKGRPDLVVLFPGRGAMPVDAKSPLEDFEAAEKGGKGGSAYAKVVKGHVDALSKRDYPRLLMENGFDPTSFTVAYIPVASWLQEAVAGDGGLLEYAFSRGVILCSAASFWALLQSVKVSWKNWGIEEDAQEIKKIGSELLESMEKFAQHASDLGSGLQKALDGYNSLIGNVDSRVIPRARKLRDKVGIERREFKSVGPIKGETKTSKFAQGGGEK